MTASSSSTATCFFNDCDNPVLPNSWKCVFHRHRARCLVSGCQNQVYARSLCVRHGGKKQCEFDGCNLNARLGNVCSKHGAGNIKKRCTHEGCTKQANARQKCVRHGGGRKCKVDGCSTHARSGGFCRRHSRASTDALPTSPHVLKIEAPRVDFGSPTSTTLTSNELLWLDVPGSHQMSTNNPATESSIENSLDWKLLSFHDPMLLSHHQSTAHLEDAQLKWTDIDVMPQNDMLDILEVFDL
ncbi:unnamed protein product [Aphanomyces euteiches]|uniref:Uncharacterized protein n=1 Tax=Aphanomyces euteiches TaxID=100861 RepID=A0A6G0XCX8_9STRA|nr:hypothetical protein Ae201684_005914 [Aphanomyces euteiches]KAH9068738.1 hypothetical protein Ae201684P_004439 [Aphanomyces euteiches]KAH9103716.1 hypothetical protein AeMF1_020008 [Aphanomyces euteiches]KAH9133854.1 hypothetical protein LEN26_006968 [Aphanomyces euteiches]KAH9156090.1 hypothetical protein AeRB84_001986 [Aphanomyces euteiches]